MTPLDRERGGTFTFVALVLAALMLVSAGLLVDASRNTLQASAQSARRSALVEGAFAGARWATLAPPKDQAAGATLELMTCRVMVAPAVRQGDGIEVTCTAENALGESVVIVAAIHSGEITAFSRR